MARRNIFTNSMSAGEIAPDLLVRTDLETRNEGLKQARNVLINQGGGAVRRWGTDDLAGLPGDCIVRTLGVGDDDARILVFYPGGFQERGLDGALVDDVGGAPWSTADIVHGLKLAIEEDRIVVTSRSFFPIELTRSGGTWSLSNFQFAAGYNSGLRQPYWRYADPGVTIAPSGYTGGVNVVASAAVFSASHVGYRIRYAGIEMEVASYVDAMNITANVLGTLYPTVAVTVASSDGFSVGQSVEGETTQLKGVVSEVVDSTHVAVQMLGTYSSFDTTEKLVGPTAFSAISAVSSPLTPAASVDWDEAMISPARGYPGACAFHHSRLLFGDFPSAKNGFAASATGDITDFDVGTGLDTDAIVDTIGSDATLGIRHFGSTEQLIFLTEAGPHYVPEQVAAPLSATNLELLRIGPESAGEPPPVLAAEGLLFSETPSGRLMAAIPTGNVRRSWDIADLSELAYHLMGTPTELALVAASSQSDRLVCSLRDDGKMAVMTYRRNQQFTAWSLWDTVGAWKSITAAAGQLYAVSQRTVGGLSVYRLERFSADALGDGLVVKPGGSGAHLNGATVTVWTGDSNLGTKVVSGGDVSGLPGGVTDYSFGFDFLPVVEVVPPIDPQVGLSRRGRVTRAWLDLVNSANVQVNGFSASGYINQTGVGGGVTPVTDQLMFNLMGRSRDPSVLITQTAGGPFDIRSITMEVTN